MRIVDLFEKASGPLFSYEIIPPTRGGSVGEILQLVEELLPYEPPFIDVTSHAAQIYFEELDDGSFKKHTKRKRPGTLGLCAAIKGRYGIETVPHLLCSGFSREETEDALIELNYLGIHNVMALRGDDAGFKKPVRVDRSANVYSSDLVGQISAMNQGRYLEDLVDAVPTEFCIGVAGYPEKHFESPNQTWDILSVKKKVDAGAHYIVTQMFFDNAVYFEFVDRCRSAGIDVPIIPGLKILTSKRQLRLLPGNFYIGIPEALAAEVEATEGKVSDVGVEWAIQQCDELLSAGVPSVHFYIMKRAKTVRRVIDRLRKLS